MILCLENTYCSGYFDSNRGDPRPMGDSGSINNVPDWEVDYALSELCTNPHHKEFDKIKPLDLRVSGNKYPNTRHMAHRQITISVECLMFGYFLPITVAPEQANLKRCGTRIPPALPNLFGSV